MTRCVPRDEPEGARGELAPLGRRDVDREQRVAVADDRRVDGRRERPCGGCVVAMVMRDGDGGDPAPRDDGAHDVEVRGDRRTRVDDDDRVVTRPRRCSCPVRSSSRGWERSRE